MRALLIPVAADWYGLPLAAVTVVVEPRTITRVPGAPPAVRGIINVRGNVVVVLDTAALLGFAPLEEIAAVVVARAEHGLIGLGASGMPQAVALDEELGPTQLETGVWRYRADVGPVTLLDLEATVDPVRVRVGA